MDNFLCQNLELLLKINPKLVAKIASINSLSSKFSFVYNKQGDAILVKDSVILNNATEPLQEAAVIFQNTPVNSENDTYIIVGFELGYLLSHFADNYKGTIIVWERCLETLRLTLELIDYSAILNKENIFIVSDYEELNSVMAKTFNRKGKIRIAANEYYYNNNKDFITNLSAQLEEIHNEPYEGGSLKLNIGAGSWALKGWRTLDCYKEADFYVDLRTMDKLEIEDNCIEKAFSSHCIEHVKDEHIEKLFTELHRCMKHGGLFRLSCPDVDKAFNAYKKNDAKWFNWLKQSHIGEMLLNTIVSYEHLAGGPQASEELVKEKFESLTKDEFIEWCTTLVDESRPYIAHRNGIYFDKLKKMLEKAGFKNIKRSSYMQSTDKELRSDKFDKYEDISLFVECCK